ncbi:MAG: hypothetical protein II453_17735 [Alphaproteobacteria bacterium]|nr:hypothetical protein [Alphaproteobacteria bacterium]
MTNAQIILEESIRLMKEGKIKGTGEKFTVKYDDGTTKEFEVPEQIHTFATWKELGYVVKRGQKAIAKFAIWKYVSKKKENTDKEDSKMFMKVAAFFSKSQVEKIEA